MGRDKAEPRWQRAPEHRQWVVVCCFRQCSPSPADPRLTDALQKLCAVWAGGDTVGGTDDPKYNFPFLRLGVYPAGVVKEYEPKVLRDAVVKLKHAVAG